MKTEANPGNSGSRTAPGTATYTITVSNTGPGGAAGVRVYDTLPAGFTYASGATATFNGSGSPLQVTGGIPGADRGIVWQYNGNIQSLTNVGDGDAAQYFPPGVDPKSIYPNVNCGGANTNGAVVVDLGDLRNATSPPVLTPEDSYGFIRFRGRVK